MLDEKGQPTPVERALICPPHSQVGPITAEQRQKLIEGSTVFGTYEKAVDRESAYERLQGAHAAPVPGQPPAAPARKGGLLDALFGGGASSTPAPLPASAPRGRQPDSLATVMAKSAVRSIGNSIGREVIRGLMGSIFGGARRR